MWTQVNTLARARQQVVDYLDTVDKGVEHAAMNIVITPQVLGWQVASESQQAAQEAEEQRHHAS